jgi:hypothetical protein
LANFSEARLAPATARPNSAAARARPDKKPNWICAREKNRPPEGGAPDEHREFLIRRTLIEFGANVIIRFLPRNTPLLTAHAATLAAPDLLRADSHVQLAPVP